mgnify:CR=1 FL=1|jgi:single-strand DNA-binding protein
MSGSINKVIVIGNLGKDPEFRSFDNGGKICNLSVATTETWKDKNTGEKKEKTEWHRVTVRQNGTSKIIDAFIEPYVKKGHKVYVEGKLETRKWQDDSSVDRYSTEIIVSGPGSTFELLTQKNESTNSPQIQENAPVLDDQIPDWS